MACGIHFLFIYLYFCSAASGPVTFDLECDGPEDSEPTWTCVWRCITAAPTLFLTFSPDGTLFATAAANDRLVKIWYDNKT